MDENEVVLPAYYECVRVLERWCEDPRGGVVIEVWADGVRKKRTWFPGMSPPNVLESHEEVVE